MSVLGDGASLRADLLVLEPLGQIFWRTQLRETWRPVRTFQMGSNLRGFLRRSVISSVHMLALTQNLVINWSALILLWTGCFSEDQTQPVGCIIQLFRTLHVDIVPVGGLHLPFHRHSQRWHARPCEEPDSRRRSWNLPGWSETANMSATAGRCQDANSNVKWQLCYDVTAKTWWMVSESFHFKSTGAEKLTGCCGFVQAAVAVTHTFTFLTPSSRSRSLLQPAEQKRDRWDQISLLNQPCTVKIPHQWRQLGPSADQYAVALWRQREEEKLPNCFL